MENYLWWAYKMYFFLFRLLCLQENYHKIWKIMSLQYNLYKILYRKYFFVEKLTDLKLFFVGQNCFDNHSEIRIWKHRTTFCPKVLVYSFIRNAMLIPIILTLLFSRLYWLMMWHYTWWSKCDATIIIVL